MQTAQVQAESVKDALRSGKASASTVTTLQSLLRAEAKPKVANEAKSTTGRTTKAAPKPTTRTVCSKNPSQAKGEPQDVLVHGDAANSLGPKEQYALATEVVNLTLKVLSDALKTPAESRPRPKHARNDGPTTPSTPRPFSRSPSSISERALQPKSINTTPLATTRAKSGSSPRKASRSSPGQPRLETPHLACTGESSRLAFSFLRSVDTRKLGVRELPPLQLENGMLALTSKLVAHGLESPALKELRVIKQRLESAGKPRVATQPEKETLATLLRLNIDQDKLVEILPLVITFQNLVLRIIATSRKPASIESSIEFLELACETGPANLIIQQGRRSGNLAKTGKLLESLSSTILGLCPRVSSSVDGEAMNRNISPAPECALKLQVIGLEIRRIWWTMVQHQPDTERELLEPLSRCIAAFARRSAATRQAYQSAKEASNLFLKALDVSDSAGYLLICRTLSTLAESIGSGKEAMEWSDKMFDHCAQLPQSHAKRLAVMARQSHLALASGTQCRHLADLRRSMQTKLAGSGNDFEFLLLELSQLTSGLRPSNNDAVSSQDAAALMPLSAGFALRFVRSYPGRALAQAQSIVCNALRWDNTAPSWISKEAAEIFISTGTLSAVAEAACSMPAHQAWSSSSAALYLMQILKLLVARVIKGEASHATAIPETTNLSVLERGCLLECQLKAALEYAPRPRYHDAARKVLHEILRCLHTTYTASEHPIRRAHIATQMLRLHEACPELLPPHRLQVWVDTNLDTEAIGDDIGVLAYRDSVRVALQLAKLFHEGQPAPDALTPLIVVLQRNLDKRRDAKEVSYALFDPEGLLVSLSAVSAFLGALDQDTLRLKVLDLQARISDIAGNGTSWSVDTKVELAKHLLHLGFAERAERLLAGLRASSVEKCDDLASIYWHVAYANYQLTTDQPEKARSTLKEARRLRETYPPKDVPRERRAAYERMHADGWLAHSRHLVESGEPAEALAAAKHAVKLLNSTWHRLEKGEEPTTGAVEETIEASDADVGGLETGVSKLRLSPKSIDKDAQPPSKGAAFWPLIPLLSRALTHLSDLYSHHGLYPEASYYSTKAVEVADSVKGSVLSSRARSHRAALLSLCDRPEEAELCLTRGEALNLTDAPLAAIERLRVEAVMRAREGSPEGAIKLYKQAEDVLASMKSVELLTDTEIASGDDGLATPMSKLSLEKDTTRPKNAPTAKTKRSTRSAPATGKSTRTARTVSQVASSAKRPASAQSAKLTANSLYMLDKLRAGLMFEKFLVGERGNAAIDDLLTKFVNSVDGALWQREIQYHQLVEKAAVAMQTDVTYNILPESTLACPAIMSAATASDEAPGTQLPESGTTKAEKRKKTSKQGFSEVLREARRCLLTGHADMAKYCTTSSVHGEVLRLAQVSLLLSASNLGTTTPVLHPVQAGFTLESARMHALFCEQAMAPIDSRSEQRSTPFEWPSPLASEERAGLSTANFQADYVDILPKPWTAVSLVLNEDCSELYAVRYRAGQMPFVLRLPFARNQSEESDECFDFTAGKAELDDIIQLSNYSCHNNGDVTSKTAKSSWWTEREALDRRLQELLINMEEIWFGGFKGILSPNARHMETLTRFRKSFDAILNRHLPSRKAAKGRSKNLDLDHSVLELFVNLGSDHDETVDLDEPVSDLLYFIVDVLQFNGERNAYDEVDFDEMTVEVLDALKAYHQGHDQQSSQDDAHVVLVLDKRLQAFPWENLPCLANVSVSRVGSMLSLRDCIVAMRNTSSATVLDTDSRHVVPRSSGSYILNPSADLGGTQASLEPALRKAASASGAQWTSIVNRAPSEDEFKSELEGSAITLYFGHGAGSQYIRPRTVRKLDKCSEVVWLMGCSSGAVTEYGELEPQAVPLAYLLAGKKTQHPPDDSTKQPQPNSKCLSIVATLWDVTDKDIDRFSLAVGEEWGLWPASSSYEPTKLPAKTPKKRDRMLAPSTPQQVPKTPKTPKVKKTPAPAKTPVRSRSRARQNGVSLTEAVARSRDACYLRYLNGAAPVVYGIPVYLGD